jgi:hypothetical protein
MADKRSGTKKLTKDQARELARGFLELSHALGTWRFDHWSEIAATDRKRLEEEEWDLLNASSTLVTRAVGLSLDDLEKDLGAIRNGTLLAKRAVARLRGVKDAIALAASFVTLSGAIVAGSPVAIALTAAEALTVARNVSGRNGAEA